MAFAPFTAPGSSYEVDKESVPHIWLVTIGVLPEFQKQGIAKRAMELAIGWAKLCGFARMISNFRDSNIASRFLHDRCGFQFVDFRPEYYFNPIEDAEVVELVL